MLSEATASVAACGGHPRRLTQSPRAASSAAAWAGAKVVWPQRQRLLGSVWKGVPAMAHGGPSPRLPASPSDLGFSFQGLSCQEGGARNKQPRSRRPRPPGASQSLGALIRNQPLHDHLCEVPRSGGRGPLFHRAQVDLSPPRSRSSLPRGQLPPSTSWVTGSLGNL